MATPWVTRKICADFQISDGRPPMWDEVSRLERVPIVIRVDEIDYERVLEKLESERADDRERKIAKLMPCEAFKNPIEFTNEYNWRIGAAWRRRYANPGGGHHRMFVARQKGWATITAQITFHWFSPCGERPPDRADYR
jgi:hypothetical protein